MAAHFEPDVNEPFDAAALVTRCIEGGADSLLLDEAALPPEFFDLSTGVAGETSTALPVPPAPGRGGSRYRPASAALPGFRTGGDPRHASSDSSRRALTPSPGWRPSREHRVPFDKQPVLEDSLRAGDHCGR